MLWIGIHLPLLSLESFRAPLLPGVEGGVAAWPPVALLEGPGSGGARIAAADAAARALGVRPGLKRATALALAPTLVLGLADARRDRQAIGALAQAALAFAPVVTLEPWTTALGDLGLQPAAGGTPSAGRAPAGPAAADDGQAPHTVLLEVQATLALFGGRGAPPALQLRRLLQRLHAALAPLGHTLQCAVAPTATGAALMARRASPWALPPGAAEPAPAPRGRGARASPVATPPGTPGHREPHDAPCTALLLPTPAALERALDAAPVWLLGPGREHWEALQGMGLRTVGDLRRLPRAGVARRFGEALLDELDRALGARPDPRPGVALPGHFSSRLELFARADTTEQVLHGAQVLLARLAGWLGAQQAQARRVALHLHHERWRAVPRGPHELPARTTLEVALAEPSADAAHLALLLRERLGHLPMPAPALELSLSCHDLARQPPPNGELFPSAASQREGWVRLIECLQARLGPEGVVQLQGVDDHRPEQASTTRPASAARRGGAAAQTAATRPLPVRGAARAAGQDAAQAAAAAATLQGPARPVYLLAEPTPLREGPHGPQLGREPLQLVSGPERLETGWWDGDDAAPGFVERDYFIAQTPGGALVWIYRLRRPPLPAEGATGPEAAAAGWFLQGRFG
jgi:protein ImuB